MGLSHKTVSTDHSFWRERRTEAQPDALPLGQTGSHTRYLFSASLYLRDRFFRGWLFFLIIGKSGHHHSTLLLEKLHWLTISERIKYKVACICFKAIIGSSLNCYTYTLRLVHYALLLTPYPHAKNLAIQKQDSWLSHILLLWTAHLEFSPTRQCSTLSSFKARLKTFLFSQYFRPS